MRPSLLAVALAAGLVAAACGELDEAELVDPGAPVIEADPGELRVLRHHDDPTAGDEWIEVLQADPEVVIETGRFREADSRDAEADQPADVRLLYEAVTRGRTLLVQLNCRGCEAGVPVTDPGETELLVWDFVVGDTVHASRSLGRAAAQPGVPHGAVVGDHVVIVRAPDAEAAIGPFDAEVLRFVARHVPADGADVLVDVFTAVGPGEATLAYGTDEYAVTVA